MHTEKPEILKLFSMHGNLTMQAITHTGDSATAPSEAIVSVGEKKISIKLDRENTLYAVGKQLMEYLQEQLPTKLIQYVFRSTSLVEIIERDID